MSRQRRFSKTEWSWIMYDWANSIYATNIMAAIYPTIFASAVPGGDIRWGYATSAATLVIALLAPLLGAIADYKGMKKKLFTLFMLVGVFFTPLMVFSGHWKVALLGYIVSHIGFNGSCLFYDSFLTDITTDERMDKVSSWGFSMGYIGGSTIPFLISIAVLLICDYSPFALAFSVLIVSVWWLVFSIPMLKNVHHEHYIEKPEKISVSSILGNVLSTFKSICSCKGLLLFMLAYFFYIDGVDTVISISTAYGTILGLGSTGLIMALLATQIIAVPCSLFFARLSEKISARKSIMGAIGIYICVCLLGFYMGFSMEPAQEAYEKVFDSAYAACAVSEEYKSAADGLVKGIKAEYKTAAPDISTFTLNENPELAEEIKTALSGAAEQNADKVTAFRDSLAFSTNLFWIMAAMVGMVQGGIQAVSRSYFGKLIPKERSNEYYGFFDIFGKFASFLGPMIYSTAAALTGRSSYGVLGLAILFICGMILLACGKKHICSLEAGAAK